MDSSGDLLECVLGALDRAPGFGVGRYPSEDEFGLLLVLLQRMFCLRSSQFQNCPGHY